MKTFTTVEQDQMMEYATMVAKYAHMVAFLTAYPKGDAEMQHCKENLNCWVKHMEELLANKEPPAPDGCKYCGDYMECDFGDCDCECHKPPSLTGEWLHQRQLKRQKEDEAIKTAISIYEDLNKTLTLKYTQSEEFDKITQENIDPSVYRVMPDKVD